MNLTFNFLPRAVVAAYLDEQNAEVDILVPRWSASREVEDDILDLDARVQILQRRVGQLQHCSVRDANERRY